MATTTERLERKQLNKKILMITVPIALQGIVSSTLGLVDDIMVGFLGEAELAGVGVGTQLTFIHFMLIYGLTSGIATFFAQFYGANDMKSIRKCVGFAWTVLFVIGLLFFGASHIFGREILLFYAQDEEVIAFALTYLKILSPQFLIMSIVIPIQMALRATQQTKIPMVISFVVFSTNTLLNYILIFGKFGAPELGVTGAALGTIIARSIEIVITILVFMSSKNVFRGPIRSFFGWEKTLIKKIMKNSAPTTINELFWGLAQTMFTAAFNRIGTTEYAAFQASNAITQVMTFGAFSLGDAALIMIGEKLGEKNKEEAWEISKYLIKLGFIVGTVIGLIIIVSSSFTSQFFNLTEQGQKYIAQILIITGIILPIGLPNAMHIIGTLRGGGDTKFAMFTEVGCIWLIAVPLAFLSATTWHLSIVYAVLLVRLEDVAKFGILTWRYMSKKWMNIVITGIGDSEENKSPISSEG